ncbi:rhodanese-like domain-containing protein [Actinomyces wuliandei]|uniref:rhodanese-like domain-containing protein n=1 Tax=Actinomyces wuliandei TaxID=2057743 RepID=UPI000FD8A26A|nr:rhodanese-like domain-containing protein [Actinomyces wuliandei]
MREISAAELRRRLDAGENLIVLDVREPDEVTKAAINGAVSIPLGEVVERRDALDSSRTTAVICAGGVRSARAIEALTEVGYEGELLNVTGGMRAWLEQQAG